jgi:hypothetical protein
MSCHNFPVAIFAGIHNDGSIEGLASTVRRDIPEAIFIVDLDTGDIDCNCGRFERLKDLEKIEAMCQDGNIGPGQEPTAAKIEAALNMADVSFVPIFDENDTAMIDDRAFVIRFCSSFGEVLGGYGKILIGARYRLSCQRK